MSRKDQVVVSRVDLNIKHRNRRQVLTELHPMASAVGGREQAEFGTKKKQVRIFRMLAYDLNGAVLSLQIRGYRTPGFTVIVGFVNIDLKVPIAMTVERCECGPVAGPGSNDARYICAFRQARNFINDILPGLTVAGYLQIAIIGARP